MWYLVMGLSFLGVGVGLAIWIAKEVSAKTKAVLELSKVTVQRDRYAEVAKQNEEACGRLEKQINAYFLTIEELNKKISTLQQKLLENWTVEELRKYGFDEEVIG